MACYVYRAARADSNYSQATGKHYNNYMERTRWFLYDLLKSKLLAKLRIFDINAINTSRFRSWLYKLNDFNRLVQFSLQGATRFCCLRFH